MIKPISFLLIIFYSIPFSMGQNNTLNSMKTSTIKIEGLRYCISKGNIKVKTNYSDENSVFMLLPVHVIHSSNPSPKEPVFWLAGGPGVSNIKQKPSKKILEDHDFVLIGYRGVDGEIKLKSRSIKKAVKGKNNALLGENSISNMQKSCDKYIKQLAKNNINLDYFTVIDVVDDIENIRKDLGYEKINLLSASYGTRVALLYGYKYPSNVNRSVMAGVNPPGHFVWYPEKTEEIIERYDSLLKNNKTYPYNITIREAIEKSFTNIPERWTIFRLDADKIKAASFVLLYRKQGAVMVFDAYIKAAIKNDYSGLYLMQLAYDYLVPGMFTWGDLFNKGASADFVNDTNFIKNLYTDKTKIGAPLSVLIWEGGNNWPDIRMDEKYRKVKKSDVETLMIGGNLDISTPPEYATEELLPYMPNAKQIILKNMAHVDDLMYLQKEAFDTMVSTYYNTGIVDIKAFTNDQTEFKLPVSFNGLAKWLYPVVFIMSLFK